MTRMVKTLREQRDSPQTDPSSSNRFFQLNTFTLFPKPASILDFLWYPSATPQNPASFYFLASVRECPFKLINASDRRVDLSPSSSYPQLRPSYRIVDHRERQIAPHALAFNPPAQKYLCPRSPRPISPPSTIYCEYEDALEIFDLSSPGSGPVSRPHFARKSKDGLKCKPSHSLPIAPLTPY